MSAGKFGCTDGWCFVGHHVQRLGYLSTELKELYRGVQLQNLFLNEPLWMSEKTWIRGLLESVVEVQPLPAHMMRLRSLALNGSLTIHRRDCDFAVVWFMHSPARLR